MEAHHSESDSRCLVSGSRNCCPDAGVSDFPFTANESSGSSCAGLPDEGSATSFLDHGDTAHTCFHRARDRFTVRLLLRKIAAVVARTSVQ